MKSLVLFVFLAISTSAFAQVVNDTAVNLNFSGRLNHAKGAAILSNPTVDLNSVAGNLVHITGTTTVTSFGTASQAGIKRTVIFDGALVLSYNASTLVFPGSANVNTLAGDVAEVVADTTTKWIVTSYVRRASVP